MPVTMIDRERLPGSSDILQASPVNRARSIYAVMIPVRRSLPANPTTALTRRGLQATAPSVFSDAIVDGNGTGIDQHCAHRKSRRWQPLGSVEVSSTLAGSPGAVAEFNLDEVSFRRLHVIGTTFSGRREEELAAISFALLPQILPAVGAGLIKAR